MGMLGYETDTHGISYASWCAKCNLGFNLFFSHMFSADMWISQGTARVGTTEDGREERTGSKID